jgi:hypothetical protein
MKETMSIADKSIVKIAYSKPVLAKYGAVSDLTLKGPKNNHVDNVKGDKS